MPIPSETTFFSSFESVRSEAEALAPSELAAINLDVHAAVVTALGCMPELEAYRGALEARFGREWVRHLDRLETYAKAAAQAHGEYLGSQTSSAELQELSRQVVEMRELLLTDATSLVNRKLVEPQALAGLRGTVGFRNQVLDVIQLTSLFRRSWERVRASTPVKVEDLERAEQVSTQLAKASGVREQGPANGTAMADARQRTFTLFLRTYDELRRAMTFLRWHEGDVDTIIPSLYAGRGGRGRRVESEPTDGADPTPSPSSDLGSGGGPVLETKPVAGPTEQKPTEQKPAPEQKPTEQKPRVGMPGTDPFVA